MHEIQPSMREQKQATQSALVAELMAAPEYINPAISLAVEVMRMELLGNNDDVDRAIRYGAVERAIVEGEKEGRAVMNAAASCGHTPPVASKTVPVGF